MAILVVNTVRVIRLERMKAFVTIRRVYAFAKKDMQANDAIVAHRLTSVIPIALNVCAMKLVLMDRYVTRMESVLVDRISVDLNAAIVHQDSINIPNVFPVPVIIGALMVSLVITLVDVFAKINLKVLFNCLIAFYILTNNTNFVGK